MTHNPGSDDAFIERVARPLRDGERADATFEARAMSAVHAAARSDAAERANRSWWLRPRTIRLTPLALAAGFAGLVLAGSAALNGVLRKAPSVQQAARADTVHIVRFVLLDASARQVALVGEFNQWQRGAMLLTAARPGVWTVDVPLRPGRHEYAFVVTGERGERWIADPTATTVRDEFGTESSVISVGTRSTS